MRSRLRIKRFLGIALFVALSGSVLYACGSADGTRKVEYAVTAKENYDKAEEALKEEDWLAAAKYYAFIKARFPYSKFVPLAELRMGDAEFGAGRYPEAIDQYKTFIKFRPTHEMVTNGYAAFRICEAYYKMLPDDFFILPPSEEKDQTTSSEANLELKLFLDRYPDSEYVVKAKEMMAEITRRLAEHEMYVAQYYWDRDRPMGTVLRLRRLLEEHKGTPLDPEALWLLGEAYTKVKMLDRARESWETLVRDFPKHKKAAKAKSALAGLKG
jgi:outer membrane protein assembly factor BamD